ncbi:hypothetical protein [Agarilytica rhodophyticola]|uniref:hypothetical protein n=1 Tax=Agarilytica rhodophyticola TaxID=1737490 RepID=UPI00131A0CC3|nr:hypothetical protein [Agarilytica rhodophyticola]
MTTKKEVEAERNRQKIESLKRKGKLDSLRDKIIFVSSLGIGIPATALGGIEFLEPALLNIIINGKEVGLVGLLLVGGPGAVKAFIKAIKVADDV